MNADAAITRQHETEEADWAVPGDRVRIWVDEFHVLHVSVDGQEYENIRPRQVFPLSGKSSCVSFLNEKSEEILLLSRLDRLDPESRSTLEQALQRLYYAAVITRVDSVTEAMGVSLWHVVTDRGYAQFEVVDRQRHIRIMEGGRFLITDADGNRFEIPCIYDLDETSRRLVETET